MMREAAKIGPATIASWRRSRRPSHIPSRVFAPVSASYGSPAIRARHASRRPAAAAMTSARPPIARSNRSCSVGSIVPTRMTSHRTGHQSDTATSEALATTIKERRDDADIPNPRPRRARTHRHGEGARRQQRQPDIATLAFEDRLALLATAKRPRRKSIGPRGLDKALFQKLVAGAPEPAHHRPDRRRSRLHAATAITLGSSRAWLASSF
jgi:hypothetical protein